MIRLNPIRSVWIYHTWDCHVLVWACSDWSSSPVSTRPRCRSPEFSLGDSASGLRPRSNVVSSIYQSTKNTHNVYNNLCNEFLRSCSKVLYVCPSLRPLFTTHLSMCRTVGPYLRLACRMPAGTWDLGGPALRGTTNWGRPSSSDHLCQQRQPWSRNGDSLCLLVSSTSQRFFQMNQFIDTIFNRPRNPTAILFLVEDSDFMNCLQRSLRDSYLLLVLEVISRNNAPDLVCSPTCPSLKLLLTRIPRPKCYGCRLPIAIHSRHPLIHYSTTNYSKITHISTGAMVLQLPPTS